MAHRWIAENWGSPDGWRLVEYEPPAPRRGEVTIRTLAAGVNPADAKHVAAPRTGVELPVPIGYEVSGVVTAVGPETEIVTGAVAVGDEVIAFRVRGGYADELTVPAEKVLRKPATLSHPEAANLLLAGTTAADMLQTVRAAPGETVLLHGASGAVGVSVLQLAALRGIRVIGTARRARFDVVRRFGGVPVAYGDGLLARVLETVEASGAAGIDAALDAVGTDEAVDVSLALLSDLSRVVTIAAAGRAEQHGFRAIAGSQPESARFRDGVRARLVELAEEGRLVVPMSRMFALSDAPAALRFLADGHPGGKVALVP
ncbi:NADP-dependent oxidoreductase [Microbacterium sp.]|uniref:NADP-dependent oxidoreductase n=1 Tax=Microbacterium sp. TaxID=51671 RepID=UPI0028110363|nr:NADP-dependent oxidoreductase [Microbacterium sp.]